MSSKKLVFATNNRHKLEEASAILGAGVELATPAELGVTEDIPETSDTLSGNALEKARYLRERLAGVDPGAVPTIFADDTGLEVEALSGAPGVYSARYAGMAENYANFPDVPVPEHPTFDDNCRLLLRNLAGEKNRRARFRTVVALLREGEEHLFEGTVEGTITTEYRGEGGFGYDPIFVPTGPENPLRSTFAQMTAEQKNAISHRGRAIEKLKNFLEL